MNSANQQLFLIFNAAAGASPWLVVAARVIASDAISLVPILLACLWIWGPIHRRAELAATAVATALALAANQVIGALWYEPRPFMVGLGHTLLSHAPENSFPSDHTTFLLAVGFGLLTTRAAPAFGKLVVLLGLLVGWARIYLGLHFPVDMLASAIIAAVFSIAAVLILMPVRRWVIPMANVVYDAALNSLHLPAHLFPRQDR